MRQLLKSGLLILLMSTFPASSASLHKFRDYYHENSLKRELYIDNPRDPEPIELPDAAQDIRDSWDSLPLEP